MKHEGMMLVEVIYLNRPLHSLEAANDAFAKGDLHINASDSDCCMSESSANTQADEKARTVTDTNYQSGE
jgi:hypothetical protein